MGKGIHLLACGPLEELEWLKLGLLLLSVLYRGR